mmetsp:Transcript_17941/g.26873  ORF Transcript_17941/g.26873 Transcript_17941/m.26873 type:complete len:762 (-) Transcript_17941:100-2385(-)|eukprot:CAMPEP_0167764074 /NCGR_PEP_ID=MMETSP0110_2-20121227/13794_1 /TAXON_ID=629695 /ORGANISM="Gymnochlora sp., Strain CCMP2014" /LENGTH=761 /DNA_ID=CAMNT_0007651365 /DNA_START=79 /DNA_END=2364 /DNA_ORIENTATION=+
MASNPGPLYTFPWHSLGNLKYALFVPLVMHHVVPWWSDDTQGHFDDHMIIIATLRYIQMFLWQFVSRFNPISLRSRIQKKNIEFEQLDREDHWDDYIILQALLTSIAHRYLPGFQEMPAISAAGIVAMLLVHIGPIEFVYYWFHRALHHDFLWQRYHSHHHASFVTEAISGTVHPFMEHIAYTAIFSTSVMIPYLLGVHCLFIFYAYALGFDWLNALGHCNFEFLPSIFNSFPLKYLVYTPSFHSLHHSKVHTNYCLFMPIYDYMFGTYCSESGKTYQRASSTKQEDVPSPDVIFLAHAGPLAQMLHIPFISKSISSHKLTMQWWMYPLLPWMYALVPFIQFFGTHFENASAYVLREVGKGSGMRKVRCEQWAIARFAYQYVTKSTQPRITKLIEEAVLDADAKGCQVMGLGAFNKAWWINKGGDDIIRKYPKLRLRLVHGNTITAACVLHAIPDSTRKVFFTGCTSKVGRALAVRLAIIGKKVIMRTDSPSRFNMIVDDVRRYDVEGTAHKNLIRAKSMEAGTDADVWLVGKYLKDRDHKYLPKDSLALYFCFPPPNFVRNDVTYVNVGALKASKTRIEGLGNCMADLNRGVFHACHVGAIIHNLEGWTHHETGDVEYKQLDKVWAAAQKYGFRLPEEATRKIFSYLAKHPQAGGAKPKMVKVSVERASKDVKTINQEELRGRIDGGEQLLIIDHHVLDVSEFLSAHPGGEAIIKRYLGKDATSAVRGRVYNHSGSAFKMMNKYRLGKYVPSSPGSSFQK